MTKVITLLQTREVKNRLLAKLEVIEENIARQQNEMIFCAKEEIRDHTTNVNNRLKLNGLIGCLNEQRLNIQEALVRIEEESYGTCSKCEGPIELARLEASPSATTCCSCAGLSKS